MTPQRDNRPSGAHDYDSGRIERTELMELVEAIRDLAPTRHDEPRRNDINLRDALAVLVLAAAIVGGYAVLGQRVNTLEQKQESYVTKEYMAGRDSVHAEQFKALGEKIEQLRLEVATSNQKLENHLMKGKEVR